MLKFAKTLKGNLSEREEQIKDFQDLSSRCERSSNFVYTHFTGVGFFSSACKKAGFFFFFKSNLY